VAKAGGGAGLKKFWRKNFEKFFGAKIWGFVLLFAVWAVRERVECDATRAGQEVAAI